ncbi:stalk domain-containing protein [Cohnella fermenti]|uniref:Copper amine oxidase-like N-terminal domain-containing protein n=1 Tax=Cohnella fermenti TaxID=2565925 RepID=A0A4S4C4A3_9BACL|nr:stalk domain-containing protein [Cohnella fermenti]THF82606.1 hypothetical protein E6C55_05890 [Cohnella fermenti]
MGFKRWLVPSMAVLLAAVPAGCESVGGLDLNKVLVEKTVASVSVDAQQTTSTTIGFSLDWNDELLAEDLAGESEEDAAQLKRWTEWLSSVTLKLNGTRTDGDGRLLSTGVLSFGKGEIPFRLHADESALLIEVEGAKRPLYLDLGEADGLGGIASGGMVGESPWLGLAGTEEGKTLVRSVATYFIGHLPNPPSIEAKGTSIDLNGTQTNVTAVHAELNGKDLADLVPVYLDALASDEEGLKKLLTEVAAWLGELPPELQEALGLTESDLPSEEDIAETSGEMIDSFGQMKEEFEAYLEELEEDPDMGFEKSTTLVADLYVDSSLSIRKASAELTIAIPEQAGYGAVPLESVTIRFDQENWVDEDAAPIPDVEKPLRSLGADELAGMTSVRALRQFNSDSLIYDLLKNDLAIDDTSFMLYPVDVWNWEAPYYEDENGEILLPVRQTLENFEASVTYSGGKVGFYDEATYLQAALSVGSDQVKVNGAWTTWSHPVVAIDGLAYAHADDLLGLLGAQISLIGDDESGEVYGVLIERDL